MSVLEEALMDFAQAFGLKVSPGATSTTIDKQNKEKS
jgi:hypothetical protein